MSTVARLNCFGNGTDMGRIIFSSVLIGTGFWAVHSVHWMVGALMFSIAICLIQTVFTGDTD